MSLHQKTSLQTIFLSVDLIYAGADRYCGNGFRGKTLS